MYFIEFLLKKNLVTSQQVCAALVDQASRQPNLFEVVLANHLLTHDQLIEVAVLQARERIGFRLACEKLLFLSENISEKIEFEITKKTTYLTQFLASNGYIDPTQLASAIDEFSQSQNILVSGADKSLPSDSATSISSLFSDSLRVGLLAGARSLLQHERNKNFRDTHILYRDLLQKVHELKGICRYSKIDRAETMVESIEKLALASLLCEKDFDATYLTYVSECLTEAFGLIWQLVAIHSEEPGNIVSVDDQIDMQLTSVRNQLNLYEEMIGAHKNSEVA